MQPHIRHTSQIMAVSIAMPNMAQASHTPAATSHPAVPLSTVSSATPVKSGPVNIAALAEVNELTPVEFSESLLPDREPDFQAAYLNNPAPAYPMLARRMGWQGKVLVSVEVLVDGNAGQVRLQQSSGYVALDAAAMKAVKNWRFSPARQAGQLVDKWFLIPIPFVLKELE